MTLNVQQPLVSVIVAVHNETELLKMALQDLIGQTYTHIEIIVADDASNPPTEEIVKSCKDSRIQYVRLNTQSGQSTARNLALQLAKGQFICIADADDRYEANKIETQINFFLQHPLIDVVGSWANILPTKAEWNTHISHADIQAYLIINNPFIHSTVMFRSTLLNTGWEYNGKYDTAEDYELFVRNYNNWNFANIPRKLVGYLISEKENEKQIELAKEIRNSFLSQIIAANDDDKRVHYLFSENLEGLKMAQIDEWIGKLRKANTIISTKALHKILQQQRWLYFKKNYYHNSSTIKRVSILINSEMKCSYIVKTFIKIILNKPL